MTAAQRVRLLACRAGLVLAVAVTASLVATKPAEAAFRPLVWGNNHWQMCLTADYDGRWHDPGGVYLEPCHKQEHQFWYADYDTPIVEMRLMGPPLGPANKCLDAWTAPVTPGTPTGYRITTYTCHGGAQQKWRWEWVPNTANGYVLQNQLFGLCLDANPHTKALGLYPCHRDRHQQWVPV